MHECAGQFPPSDAASLGFLDEDWIKVRHGQLADFLLDDPAWKGIATTNFQHVLASRQHPCREFIAGEREGQPLGVVVPRLIHHQAEFGAAMGFSHIQQSAVLDLAGRRFLIATAN